MRSFLKTIVPKTSQLIFSNKFTLINNYHSHEIHYHDIVPLKYAKNPFFIIENFKVELSPEKNLQDMKKQIKELYPNVKNLKVYEAFTLAEFSGTSPLNEIIQNDFILKVNNEFLYKIIPELEKKKFQSFDLQKKFINNEEKEVVSFQDNLGSHKIQSRILSHFVKLLITEANKIDSPKIDSHYLKIAVKKILGEMALKEKLQEQDLQLQVEFLESKLKDWQMKKEIIIKKLDNKGKRRVNFFLGFTLTQIALIQYGTYVAFSWDIIEPITCLLGVVDLIIAYLFWLRSNREYSFEELNSHYIFRRINSRLNKELTELSLLKTNYEEEIKDVEKLLCATLIQKDVFTTNWQNLKNYFMN